MEIKFWLNGKMIKDEIEPDILLLEYVRSKGCYSVTLEGVQERAIDFGTFLAKEGAEQCGYCSPGFIMNVLAMEDELENPTEREIKEYLSGNLCRCTGYQGQLRAIKKYLDRNKEVANNEVCK